MHKYILVIIFYSLSFSVFADQFNTMQNSIELKHVTATIQAKTKEINIHLLQELHHAINNLLFKVNVCKKLVSETVAQLLSATQTQQLNSTTAQGSGKKIPIIK